MLCKHTNTTPPASARRGMTLSYHTYRMSGPFRLSAARPPLALFPLVSPSSRTALGLASWRPQRSSAAGGCAAATHRGDEAPQRSPAAPPRRQRGGKGSVPRNPWPPREGGGWRGGAPRSPWPGRQGGGRGGRWEAKGWV